jgi:glycosyltransferase involved in cell wall biosynthesis
VRILLAGKHRFPASHGGPSGGRIFDFLAKGLGRLGHEVLYLSGQGADGKPPDGVCFVDEPRWDVDLLHSHSHIPIFRTAIERGLPWVATCHTDLETWALSRDAARDNWIFVSETLAKSYGRSRFVLNGIDPDELIYSESKEDYLLFVCALRLAERKGLDTAIDLARQCGLRLVVAGSSPGRHLVERVAAKCALPGIRYVGEIFGPYKAQLFAGAAALLFPTQVNEAFGLVMAEALMSGTPVVCSDLGACGELISPDVGFVCRTQQDYLHALQQVQQRRISPQRCREVAMQRFHYLRMAREYVREYEREIAHSR